MTSIGCGCRTIRAGGPNERNYGALQGLNKAETAHRMGEEQVHAWRRSYDARPPALDDRDQRFPGHDRAVCGPFGRRTAESRAPALKKAGGGIYMLEPSLCELEDFERAGNALGG